ncbi:Holliday junction branch migration protein RuvA [Tepidanaerobacter syntrophicus]|uniref:Holliday junction branch migration complex subunit RuvA n=1 Tax=Tepidanaerobacter syntrophicus TaxID=224999 RepID=A0A0U9HT66_9FIRM|nr:Holliday junction branch migration protein RuvA [Tepidanaerobacter syntrophicus]GAQ26311.1 Holliday junction DNA helicase RuvA [Tepidanaerobacter syntrophicus]GLI19299.1 Holliday junction ATP-dependent DNA helicase RuvA [Tepidanaerobacter syntrophicus]
MLEYIKGKLVFVEPTTAVVDISGVGIKADISMYSYDKIKNYKGETITLYTHLLLKEDAIELFGFFDKIERQAYLFLNKVSGVGPKVALSVLSLMDAAKLKNVILTENVNELTKVPGIGKKTAQKIIIELKDRIKDLPVSTPDEDTEDYISEAKEALISLGFSSAEVNLALSDDLVKDSKNLEDIIKAALKKMSK